MDAAHVLARAMIAERVHLQPMPRPPSGAFSFARELPRLLRGRGYVEPDDVKELCGPCLAHRVVLAGRAAPAGELARQAAERVIRDLAEQVPAPE